MTDAEQELIVDIFNESCQIYERQPPTYWQDPHGYQSWAKARSLFRIERGVRLTAADDSAAGRKQFSRLKQQLEADGLIWITRIGPTSQFLALTPGGLLIGALLTSKWPPHDLWQTTKTMAAEVNQ